MFIPSNVFDFIDLIGGFNTTCYTGLHCVVSRQEMTRMAIYQETDPPIRTVLPVCALKQTLLVLQLKSKQLKRHTLSYLTFFLIDQP